MHNSSTLVILSPGFPKDEADSTCLPSQQLFVRSVNENYPDLKVIILTLEYPFTRHSYQWYGNTVISFNSWKQGKIKKLFTWFAAWRTLKKLKKNNHIIGLFSFFCGEGALIGTYFGRFYNIRHFAWISGQDAKKENKFVKLIRPRPGTLIANSDFLADEFYKNHGIKPQFIIPNAIDKKIFPAILPVKKDIDVLGAGSLIPLKQYDVFISVVNELKPHFPFLKAVQCGDGPEKNKLLSLIQDHNLQTNISLAGKLDHEDVLGLMQRTKVFLHPSAYEGFSTVCLEALYAGAYVISFCKPMNEAINHWYIVSSQEEMTEKALEILKNTNPDHQPVMAYSMEDSAKAVMQLFGYSELPA